MKPSSAVQLTSLALPTRALVHLQTIHTPKSPVELLHNLAREAQALNITNIDVYGDFTEEQAEKSYLRKFEREVAAFFCMEDAVFMPSGTMAQGIALQIHHHDCTENSKHHANDEDDTIMLDNNKWFACHSTSHLLMWEEEAYRELAGMEAYVVNQYRHEKESMDNNRQPMSFHDVQTAFQVIKQQGGGLLEEEEMKIRDTGLSSLIVELPHRELGGKLTPWEDLLKIKELCQSEGVAFHCDGARIFEAAAGYERSHGEIAGLFDSIYISFYKGLGGMTGAMLLGNKDFCALARVWLCRYGGNLYTLLPYAVSCWSSFRKYKNNTSGYSFRDKLIRMKDVVKLLSGNDSIKPVVEFVPTIPETNMVHCYLKGSVEACEVARDRVHDKYGIVVFNKIRKVDESFAPGTNAYFEWTIGDANIVIDNDEIIRGWKAFAKYLNEQTIEEKC